MTWIKLDDGFYDNPKILPLSDGAFRLYISALCYSNRYLTDGFLSQAVVNRLDTGLIHLELLEQGLWEQMVGGIQILKYTEHQTSKEEVTKKREQTRNRVTRYRERSNAEVTLPEYRIQNTDTEVTTSKPNGLQVNDLVKLYFDNYSGSLKPGGGQVAGQIVSALKAISAEELAVLIPLVAMDGKPLTRNTLIYAQNKNTPSAPKGLSVLNRMKAGLE